MGDSGDLQLASLSLPFSRLTPPPPAAAAGASPATPASLSPFSPFSPLSSVAAEGGSPAVTAPAAAASAAASAAAAALPSPSPPVAAQAALPLGQGLGVGVGGGSGGASPSLASPSHLAPSPHRPSRRSHVVSPSLELERELDALVAEIDAAPLLSPHSAAGRASTQSRSQRSTGGTSAGSSLRQQPEIAYLPTNSPVAATTLVLAPSVPSPPPETDTDTGTDADAQVDAHAEGGEVQRSPSGAHGDALAPLPPPLGSGADKPAEKGDELRKSSPRASRLRVSSTMLGSASASASATPSPAPHSGMSAQSSAPSSAPSVRAGLKIDTTAPPVSSSTHINAAAAAMRSTSYATPVSDAARGPESRSPSLQPPGAVGVTSPSNAQPLASSGSPRSRGEVSPAVPAHASPSPVPPQPSPASLGAVSAVAAAPAPSSQAAPAPAPAPAPLLSFSSSRLHPLGKFVSFAVPSESEARLTRPRRENWVHDTPTLEEEGDCEGEEELAASRAAKVQGAGGDVLTSATTMTLSVTVDAFSAEAAMEEEEEEPPPDPVQRCLCFRLRVIRRAAPQRFPPDSVIESGPSLSVRKRMAHTDEGLAELAKLDELLSADFVDLRARTATEQRRQEAREWLRVLSLRSCWRAIYFCALSLVDRWNSLQLFLLAALHLLDCAADLAMLRRWVADGHVGWGVVAALCIALPIIVSCITDVFRQPTNAEGEARTLTTAPSAGTGAQKRQSHQPPPLPPLPPPDPRVANKLTLVFLNLLQLRGFYEAALVRRQALSTSSSSTSGRVQDESADLHSHNLNRVVLECAPLFALQAGALLHELREYQSDDEWMPSQLTLPLLSLASSLLCLGVTSYRLLSLNPLWRLRAGVWGLFFLLLLALLHPVHKVLPFALLLLWAPWWVVCLAVLLSTLVTGWLMIHADRRSQTRRSNVASLPGVVRTLVLLAPLECASGGVALSDLVAEITQGPTATSQPPAAAKPEAGEAGGGNGQGGDPSAGVVQGEQLKLERNALPSAERGTELRQSVWRWLGEYAPLLAWHVCESIALAVAYGVCGDLWPVHFACSVAGVAMLRLVATMMMLVQVHDE